VAGKKRKEGTRPDKRFMTGGQKKKKK
jgi:hypothetical protein